MLSRVFFTLGRSLGLVFLILLVENSVAAPKPLPLEQQLGLFPKIGKRANDLLRKVPAIPQLDMEMPSFPLPDGSSIKLRSSFDVRPGREGRREGGRVVGNLSWRLRKTMENQLFPNQPAGLEVRGGVETGLENDLNVGVDYRLTPAFKLSSFCMSKELLEASAFGSSMLHKLQDTMRTMQGGVGAEYSNDVVSLAVTKPFQSPKLHFSALAGAGGWAGGIKGRHNPRSRGDKISETKLAVQYTQDDLQVSCHFTNDLEEAYVSMHHNPSPDLEIAATGRLHDRAFTVGFSHQIDQASSLKSVLDSSGSLNAAYTRVLGRSLTLRAVAHVSSLLGNSALYGIPPPRVALQLRSSFP